MHLVSQDVQERGVSPDPRVHLDHRVRQVLQADKERVDREAQQESLVKLAHLAHLENQVFF